MNYQEDKLRNQSHLQLYQIIKKKKKLWINLTKEVTKTCTLKTKTLMKEIEDNQDKCKAIMCLWIGRINIIEITIFPKAICRFNAISIKITETFFTELKKIVGNTKELQISQAVFLFMIWTSHLILFYFIYFFATLCGLWCPHFPNQDRAQVPSSESTEL